IERGNQPVEDGIVQRDLSEPQPVQQVLRAVGELGDAVLREHPREALERVGGAEDAVEALRIDLAAPLLVQREQVRRQRVDDLGGLGDELGEAFGRAAHGILRYLRASDSRLPGSNGLTRYSAAPSASPRVRSCSRPSV